MPRSRKGIAKEKRLISEVALWLIIFALVSVANVAASGGDEYEKMEQVKAPLRHAAFQVPITYIRAYTALYPEFFEKVELESSSDKGITYIDEIEKRKYILTAEEAENRTINYTMYIYDKTPDTEEEWLALAIYYLGDYRYRDDYKKAEEAAKKALELNPDSFGAYAILFYIYDWYPDMGDPAQVLEKLEKLANDSNNAKYYGLLGKIYAARKNNPFANPTKSTYYYEKAIELDPKYAPAYSGLAAYYYYQEKDYIKAKEYLDKFLELRPNDSWALYMIEKYSHTYPPPGKRDPFALVMAGIAVLFVLNFIRVLWKRRKIK